MGKNGAVLIESGHKLANGSEVYNHKFTTKIANYTVAPILINNDITDATTFNPQTQTQQRPSTEAPSDPNASQQPNQNQMNRPMEKTSPQKRLQQPNQTTTQASTQSTTTQKLNLGPKFSKLKIMIAKIRHN
jgi:hypothetical protein